MFKHLVRTSLMVAAIAIPAVAVAPPADAHDSPLHQVALPAGTDSSVRTATFTSHTGMQLTITATFGQVTSGSAFLQTLAFTLSNIQPGGILGGPAYLYNTNQNLVYDADRSTEYFGDGYYQLPVDRWFIGGGPDGRVAIALEKLNTVGFGEYGHRSNVTFYVP